jgi:hypothetical protein
MQDCLRLHQQQSGDGSGAVHIPYRESLLTRLLQPAMEGPKGSSASKRRSSSGRGSDAGLTGDKQGAAGRLVVLVTVSPCASGMCTVYCSAGKVCL